MLFCKQLSLPRFMLSPKPPGEQIGHRRGGLSLPWNRIFSLETFGGNHAVQPSSTAPLVKPSIDMPAAAVIVNYCDAHPGAPSCGSNAVLSPVATSRSEAQGLSSFQSESLSPAVAAAPTTTPSWCASISSIVFNSPGEAAKARGTCGLV